MGLESEGVSGEYVVMGGWCGDGLLAAGVSGEYGGIGAGLVAVGVVTALLTVTGGWGVSESAAMTFSIQWILPRAVFLGRVTACFVLFPTGTVI